MKEVHILYYMMVFLSMVLVLPMNISADEEENHPPVPVIRSPSGSTIYIQSRPVLLDGSHSIDADGNPMRFLWYSDMDGYLGTDPVKQCLLSRGVHRITLHVDDGISNVSVTIMITVLPDTATLDTDRDGIPDIIDDDDDNDGLLDVEEDTNRNGILDEGETDPKDNDTDDDGVSDYYDVPPRDPGPPSSSIDWYEQILLSIFMIGSLTLILSLLAAGFYAMAKYMKRPSRLDEE